MSQTSLLLLLFAFQLLVLFFISRLTIKELFVFFRRFLPDRLSFVLITIVFLPGTIMHEMAHFIMAIILLLKVRHVSILPEFEKDHIKLGKVIYEKKDIFRGILVGIAPIFFGLLFFWMLSIWKLFPHENIGVTVLIGYMIFVISTTMFSSKQDLVDLVYILPIGILFAGFIYVFNIDLLGLFKNERFFNVFENFLKQLNIYFFFSFIIHIGTIIILKVLLRIVR